ncbi:MAG: hypothetical protein H6R00_2396 [Proteobacteria bacterium]|nr:hypothetical protein [Pseudomonadota bacterium]
MSVAESSKKTGVNRPSGNPPSNIHARVTRQHQVVAPRGNSLIVETAYFYMVFMQYHHLKSG